MHNKANLMPFVNQNRSVTMIQNIVYVPPGGGTDIHINRKTSGLVFELDGESRYDFEDDSKTSLPFSKNGVLYLPKGSTYRVFFHHVNRPSCYAINFDFAVNIEEPFVYYPDNEQLILQRFSTVERIWSNKGIGYYEKAMSELYEIIYLLKQSIQSSIIPSPKQRIVSPAIKYINAHYMCETISIGQLAEMCGISETYFRTLFKELYQNSPKNYIENLRFEKAKELMNSGEYNIGTIAGLCGFFNDSYFCKRFKERFGISPSTYMNSTKNEA